MKLLANYTIKKDKEKENSLIEMWRIENPTRILEKNTDWKIGETKGIFTADNKENKISEKEANDRYNFLKDYDLVWGTYQINVFIHAFMMVMEQRVKTKFILDIDDNLFNIDPSNPFLTHLPKKFEMHLLGMAVDAKYVTTTTEILAKKLREERYYRPKESVVVVPNLISTERYKPAKNDNKDKIVIGYAGGSSHYNDLHKSNAIDALQKIMHEYKNVYVESAGIKLDKYLPKARYKFLGGTSGVQKWLDFYSTFKFDIGLAPILDTPFNICKSNIKWQEYSLMGIPTIASKVGPYQESIKHGSTGYLVDNTFDSWYNAYKLLIENETLRRKIGEKARQDVIDNWSLEKNWHKIKDGLEQLNSLDIKD